MPIQNPVKAISLARLLRRTRDRLSPFRQSQQLAQLDGSTSLTVSVIIATYNRPEPLRQAIASVLRQTHPVSEILICEDGNSNTCAQVVASFADPRVRHLPGRWAGLPAVPRNRGLHEAKGFWIAFLDDDDSWHEEKLQLQLEAALKLHRRFAATATTATPHQSKHNIRSLGFNRFLRGNPVVLSSVLVERDLVASGFSEDPNLRGLEDFHLWLQVAAQTSCTRLSGPLVNYCETSANSIRRLHAPRSGAEELQSVLMYFLAEHPNLKALSLRIRLLTQIKLLSIRLRCVLQQLRQH
jgi:teichuronic acid biosynthesis glycosyltransferase TuaG